jgi:hypothetical protein
MRPSCVKTYGVRTPERRSLPSILAADRPRSADLIRAAMPDITGAAALVPQKLP